MGRHTKKTPTEASLALEHLPEIILGFESDELAPTSPPADIPSSPPNLPPNLPPSSNRSTPSLDELDDKPTKERRINWSIEMVEQLVEVIHVCIWSQLQSSKKVSLFIRNTLYILFSELPRSS